MQDNTDTEEMQRNINASIGIRAQDHSVRVGEDCSCLSPCGLCALRIIHKLQGISGSMDPLSQFGRHREDKYFLLKSNLEEKVEPPV
jgi:hypothetical protein